MIVPITSMTEALIAGNHRPAASNRGVRPMMLPPLTNRSPTAMRTVASPVLKAATRTMPRPVRPRETAASSRTSAEGQGSSPPEIPRPSSDRQVTGDPSAPDGMWEWG